MVRGIERTPSSGTTRTGRDFVARLAALAEQGAWTVYAWALLPNHAHLLVRTGTRPLPAEHAAPPHRLRRGLQPPPPPGRPPLPEPVQVHRGGGGALPPGTRPLPPPEPAPRAGGARPPAPWTATPGPATAPSWGPSPAPGRPPQTILAQFGRTAPRARHAYRAFVAAGVPQGRRPELQGGGLHPEPRGLGRGPDPPPGPRGLPGDERMLGSAEFVEQVRAAGAPATGGARGRS